MTLDDDVCDRILSCDARQHPARLLTPKPVERLRHPSALIPLEHIGVFQRYRLPIDEDWRAGPDPEHLEVDGYHEHVASSFCPGHRSHHGHRVILRHPLKVPLHHSESSEDGDEHGQSTHGDQQALSSDATF